MHADGYTHTHTCIDIFNMKISRNIIIMFLVVPVPVVSCDASGSRIRFKCEVPITGNNRKNYEVLWFYKYQGKTVQISKQILANNQNVTYMENEDETVAAKLFHIGSIVR